MICVLFHKIKTLNSCLFTDSVSGENVGEYECVKCNKVYMANSKRSFFRVFK